MMMRYWWIGWLLITALWISPFERLVGQGISNPQVSPQYQASKLQQQPSSVSLGKALITLKGNGTTPGIMVGGYPNAPVYAIVVSGNDAYVGGAFTTAGGVTVNHIAKWDGIHWLPLGQGLNGNVNCLVAVGSEIYAGGEFTMAGSQTVNHVARWDGIAWYPMGNGLNASVSSLAAKGSDLYAVSGNGVFQWNGNSWQQLGSDMGSIAGIAVVESGIFIAKWEGVFRWDGSSWQSLPMFPKLGYDDGGFCYGPPVSPSGMTAITSYDSYIYTTGPAILQYNCGSYHYLFMYVFRWDGLSWVEVLKESEINTGDIFTCGRKTPGLHEFSLHVGTAGVFTGGYLSLNGFERWDPYGGGFMGCSEGFEGWVIYPSVSNSHPTITNGLARAFASLDGGVYYGGDFTNYFASWNIPNSVITYTGPSNSTQNHLQLYLLNASGNAPVISFKNSPPENGTLPSGIDHISKYYWQITGSATFQNGVITVPVSALGLVNNPENLRWLKRTSSGDTWQNIGGLVVNGNLESTVSFNSFSEFAIGTIADDPLGVDDKDPEKVYDYKLDQNYPNPFNPSTTIRFTMKKPGTALLNIFDVLGREVYRSSIAANRGENEIVFKGDKLCTGVYFYRLSTDGFSKTLKMMIVK